MKTFRAKIRNVKAKSRDKTGRFVSARLNMAALLAGFTKEPAR